MWTICRVEDDARPHPHNKKTASGKNAKAWMGKSDSAAFTRLLVIIPLFASLRSPCGPLWRGEPAYLIRSRHFVLLYYLAWGTLPPLVIPHIVFLSQLALSLVSPFPPIAGPFFLKLCWSNLISGPSFFESCWSHLVRGGVWQGICFCRGGIWRGNSASTLTAKVWDFWNPYFKIPLHFRRNTAPYTDKYR